MDSADEPLTERQTIPSTERPAASEAVCVTVACSPAAGTVESIELCLPAGSVVADAIARSGFAVRHPVFDGDAVRVGVWGSLRECSSMLHDGDRVELYRPLAADPKDARRARAQQARRDKRAASRAR